MTYLRAFLDLVKRRDPRAIGGCCAVAVVIIAALLLTVRANRSVDTAAGGTRALSEPVAANAGAEIKDAPAEGDAAESGEAVPKISRLPVPDTTFAPVDGAVVDGVIYLTDAYNKLIWSADADEARIHAGAESAADLYGEPIGGYNDAALSESLFGEPWGIAPFIGGLAVSDPENQAVRFLDAGGTSTVNASSAVLKSGELGVTWERPTGLAAGEDGALYVADTDAGRVVVITPEGAASTFLEDLASPTGLCCQDGMLYIAETGANRVLQVDIATGDVVVLAGSGEEGHWDGPAGEARFSSPQGVAAADDAVYVADTVNGAVRRIADGLVETVLVQQDDDLATSPVSPTGLFVDGDTLYICDRFARQVITMELL